MVGRKKDEIQPPIRTIASEPAITVPTSQLCPACRINRESHKDPGKWRSKSSTTGFELSASRLSDAHPGAHASTATVYLLRAGATRAQPIYRHRLGPSGCASGAGFGWHGSSLLYSSSDGTLAVFDTRTDTTTNLTVLARRLPHRSPAERALADWRSDFRR